MNRTLYTEDHEWLRLEGDDRAVVGITEYAQEQLGDVVFVELPKVGSNVKRGDAVATVESVKAAADVKSPISGRVIEVNAELPDQPELVNQEPAGRAWFFKLELADKSELDGLMDSDAYANFTKA